MRHLLDSCLIDHFPAGVRGIAQGRGMAFPLSLSSFIAAKGCAHSRCIRLHLRYLVPPTQMDFMLKLMREVFNLADIGVTVASRQQLTGPLFELLLDISAGINDTPEVSTLRAHRNAPPQDIVVFVVRSLLGGEGGFAHPHSADTFIPFYGNTYLLAHEVAHLLGLRDLKTTLTCDEFCKSGPTHNLMFNKCPCPTPATLTPADIAAMRASGRTFECGG